MALKIENLNGAFALGKDKSTGKWTVGQWINQALWTVDGSNKKICPFKDMTKWRYFRQAFEYESTVELQPGDRVSQQSEKGINEWYYVICKVEKSGKFIYLVGE